MSIYSFQAMLLRDMPFKDPKHIAVEFACAVTSPSANHDWVARNGVDSIFVLFKTILPEVTK